MQVHEYFSNFRKKEIRLIMWMKFKTKQSNNVLISLFYINFGVFGNKKYLNKKNIY